MDLFILWSNDLFVHLKMKNKHVHIIAGKDIFAKAQWKQAGFSLIFCRQKYFQICKNILEHQAYYRPLTLEMSLKIHVNTLL